MMFSLWGFFLLVYLDAFSGLFSAEEEVFSHVFTMEN